MLNLNIHFHLLFLEGVYVERPDGALRFRWVKAPTSADLTRLTQVLALRIGRYRERQGLLERDAENGHLASDGLEAGPMGQLRGASITYRIAVGPQQRRKVFTLQTLPACDEALDDGVGKVAGFSLHAGVAARADEGQKLERLFRYLSRPAVAEKRLSLTPNGDVRYRLKTPYRDGTTHVIFEPLDFIARLAALVPKPRVNLTRFRGVFELTNKPRVHVVGKNECPLRIGRDVFSLRKTQSALSLQPSSRGDATMSALGPDRVKTVWQGPTAEMSSAGHVNAPRAVSGVQSVG